MRRITVILVLLCMCTLLSAADDTYLSVSGSLRTDEETGNLSVAPVLSYQYVPDRYTYLGAVYKPAAGSYDLDDPAMDLIEYLEGGYDAGVAGLIPVIRDPDSLVPLLSFMAQAMFQEIDTDWLESSREAFSFGIRGSLPGPDGFREIETSSEDSSFPTIWSGSRTAIQGLGRYSTSQMGEARKSTVRDVNLRIGEDTGRLLAGSWFVKNEAILDAMFADQVYIIDGQDPITREYYGLSAEESVSLHRAEDETGYMSISASVGTAAEGEDLDALFQKISSFASAAYYVQQGQVPFS